MLISTITQQVFSVKTAMALLVAILLTAASLAAAPMLSGPLGTSPAAAQLVASLHPSPVTLDPSSITPGPPVTLAGAGHHLSPITAFLVALVAGTVLTMTRISVSIQGRAQRLLLQPVNRRHPLERRELQHLPPTGEDPKTLVQSLVDSRSLAFTIRLPHTHSLISYVIASRKSLWSFHVMSIATRPLYQGLGLASHLLETLETEVVTHGADEVSAFIEAPEGRRAHAERLWLRRENTKIDWLHVGYELSRTTHAQLAELLRRYDRANRQLSRLNALPFPQRRQRFQQLLQEFPRAGVMLHLDVGQRGERSGPNKLLSLVLVGFLWPLLTAAPAAAQLVASLHPSPVTLDPSSIIVFLGMAWWGRGLPRLWWNAGRGWLRRVAAACSGFVRTLAGAGRNWLARAWRTIRWSWLHGGKQAVPQLPEVPTRSGGGLSLNTTPRIGVFEDIADMGPIQRIVAFEPGAPSDPAVWDNWVWLLAKVFPGAQIVIIEPNSLYNSEWQEFVRQRNAELEGRIRIMAADQRFLEETGLPNGTADLILMGRNEPTAFPESRVSSERVATEALRVLRDGGFLLLPRNFSAMYTSRYGSHDAAPAAHALFDLRTQGHRLIERSVPQWHGRTPVAPGFSAATISPKEMTLYRVESTRPLLQRVITTLRKLAKSLPPRALLWFWLLLVAAPTGTDVLGETFFDGQREADVRLGAETDFFQGDFSEGGLVAETRHRVQDFQAGEVTEGVIVGSNPLGQVLGRHRRLFKPNVEGVDMGIIGNAHRTLSSEVGAQPNRLVSLFHEVAPRRFLSDITSTIADLLGGVKATPHTSESGTVRSRASLDARLLSRLEQAVQRYAEARPVYDPVLGEVTYSTTHQGITRVGTLKFRHWDERPWLRSGQLWIRDVNVLPHRHGIGTLLMMEALAHNPATRTIYTVLELTPMRKWLEPWLQAQILRLERSQFGDLQYRLHRTRFGPYSRYLQARLAESGMVRSSHQELNVLVPSFDLLPREQINAYWGDVFEEGHRHYMTPNDFELRKKLGIHSQDRIRGDQISPVEVTESLHRLTELTSAIPSDMRKAVIVKIDNTQPSNWMLWKFGLLSSTLQLFHAPPAWMDSIRMLPQTIRTALRKLSKHLYLVLLGLALFGLVFASALQFSVPATIPASSSFPVSQRQSGGQGGAGGSGSNNSQPPQSRPSGPSGHGNGGFISFGSRWVSSAIIRVRSAVERAVFDVTVWSEQWLQWLQSRAPPK